jgi:hypothetical protein
MTSASAKRDQAGARRPAGLGVICAIALGVAFVAVCCAVAVHTGCFHTPPPVERPEAGTPRAAYCDVLIPAKPWVSLTVGPTALVLAAGMLTRRRLWVLLCLSIVVCGLLVANAIIVNNLEFALTI